MASPLWPMARAVTNIPSTKNGWALAWYFTSKATGSRSSQMSWKVIWGTINNTNKTAAKFWPIAISTATMASWNKSIIAALIQLALVMPNTTGSDCSPRARSPSTLLKSLTTAIPKPARE